MPLVDYQQLEQENHRAAEVVEVVRAVLELVEGRVFEVLQVGVGVLAGDATVLVLVGEGVGVVSVRTEEPDSVLERLHPDHGVDVEEDEEDGGVGEERGQDVQDGVQDALEVVHAVQDLHNPHHSQDEEDVENDICVLVITLRFIDDVKYERRTDDDKVEDVPEFAKVHVESKCVHLENYLEREHSQKNPFNVVDVSENHKSVDKDDPIEDVTEVLMLHQTNQPLRVIAVVDVGNVGLEEIGPNLCDPDVEKVGEIVELLAVDVTTLVLIEHQPEYFEVLLTLSTYRLLHQLLEVFLDYHFPAKNVGFHQIKRFVNQVVHPLDGFLDFSLQVGLVVVVDDREEDAHEDIEGHGLEDDEEDGVEAVLVVRRHHDVWVVSRGHQDVQVPVGVGKGL